jgi:hypothetical protein
MIWPAVVLPTRPGRRIGYVMCVHPVAWPEPDPQIAAMIAAKYPGKRPRPLPVQVRDRLDQWLADEEFATVFGVRGRPGWSPSRLALVTVLQRVEKLTDRQAAEAVRTRIDWRYLLGLSHRARDTRCCIRYGQACPAASASVQQLLSSSSDSSPCTMSLQVRRVSRRAKHGAACANRERPARPPRPHQPPRAARRPPGRTAAGGRITTPRRTSGVTHLSVTCVLGGSPTRWSDFAHYRVGSIRVGLPVVL